MRAVGGYEGSIRTRSTMPCTLRIAGLVGQRCADQDTCVGAHTGNLGKGMSTKTSDLTVVSGCMICHGLIDRVLKGWINLNDDPVLKSQMLLRVISARDETQAMLVQLGIIQVPGAEII